MTRQRRLLLATLLATWVVMILACGGGGDSSQIPKVTPEEDAGAKAMSKAEGDVEEMMKKEGLSENDKQYIRAYVKRGRAWVPKLDASKPSLDFSDAVSKTRRTTLGDGDMGVPYYLQFSVTGGSACSIVTVVKIVDSDEVVTSSGNLWIKGVSTVGLKVGSQIELKGLFFVDGFKSFGENSRVPYLVAIDGKKVKAALDNDAVKAWVDATAKYQKAKAEGDAARRKQEEAAATSSDRAWEVWATSKKFVTESLKSPSTADFGDQDAEQCVSYLGNDVYQVRGWVDAQNSFGAKLRSNFELKVQRTKDGNHYKLLEGPTIHQR